MQAPARRVYLVRPNPLMKKDLHGNVANPLRPLIAKGLEKARNNRGLTQKDFVDFLRDGTPDGKFSYGTYIKTIQEKNNITLKSLSEIANTLKISVADLMFGENDAPEWTRSLNDMALRYRLALQLERIREKRAMTRVAFAKLIGIAEVTYNKLEHGRSNVTIDTIAAIALSLGVDPLEFLFAKQ